MCVCAKTEIKTKISKERKREKFAMGAK